MRLFRLRPCASSGFTLIELLLVLVILTALAAVVVPKFAGRSQDANIAATKSDIASFGVAVDAFEVDNGHYPASLDELTNQPGGLTTWRGPYLTHPKPNDPWGHPYQYVFPGVHNANGYDLHSFGPDGQDGTDDDIVNWTTN